MTNTRENKVIAHFLDGTLVRGTTLDFFPNKEMFRIRCEDGRTEEISVNKLKAVFFVNDLNGNPEYDEKKGFFHSGNQGKKLLVEFVDGETLFGYTLAYKPQGLGFFMFPGDPESNNQKVFIVHNATRRVKVKNTQRAYVPDEQ